MKYCWIAILLMITIAVHAQDVWREGTQWVTTYEDGSVETYTLKEDTIIDDTPYLRLVVEEKDSLVGYVRSVRGDTVIHARGIIEGNITEDFLLYDFGTFEVGTDILYDVYNYETGTICPFTVTIKSDASLTYYNDVIEEGDILPCYADIVFKVGYLGNPMALFYNTLFVEDSESGNTNNPTDQGKPNKKNVSHVVLKPKGKGGGYVVMYPATIKNVFSPPNDNRYYDLFGRCVIPRGRGIFIKNGKKVVGF